MLQQYTRLLLNKHQLDTVVKRTITVIYYYDLPSFFKYNFVLLYDAFFSLLRLILQSDL